MFINQNKPNKEKSSILIVYGLTQIISFVLLLAMIGFSINQTFNFLSQIEEINLITLQHIKM